MNLNTRVSAPHRTALGTCRGPQPRRDRQAGPPVDDDLHQQVAADPSRRVVQCLGGQVQVPGSEQPQYPITQIRKPQEHECNQDDHGEGCSNGPHYRPHYAPDRLQRGSWRIDHLNPRHPPRLRLGRRNPDRSPWSAPRTPRSCRPHLRATTAPLGKVAAELPLVARKLTSQIGELIENQGYPGRR